MHDEPWVSRRAYLAIAGTSALGLAGCQGDGGDETPSEEPSEEPTETDSTDTPSATQATTQNDTPEDDNALSEAEDILSTLDFEGDLFDTHLHFGTSPGQDVTVDAITALNREHNVGAATLFCALPIYNDENYDTTVPAIATDDVDYLPFFTPSALEHFSVEGFRRVYDGNESVFYGVGEMVFYSGPLEGESFTRPPLPSIYEFVGEEGLVIMLHPDAPQLDEVGPMLESYPDTSVLLHGGEMLFDGSPSFLPDLLAEYDNCYWTHDVATMTGGLVTNAGGKDAFLTQLESRRQQFLDDAGTLLPPLLEAAPDRVMWGTDVEAGTSPDGGPSWNLDPEVFAEIIDFSWEVIEELPAGHRDPFAYENAVALFGE